MSIMLLLATLPAEIYNQRRKEERHKFQFWYVLYIHHNYILGKVAIDIIYCSKLLSLFYCHNSFSLSMC